jgi:histidinol-phosphate aminotransferase
MGIFYIPSETNFITFDLQTEVTAIFEELQKRNVIVRPLGMYGKPTFLRVTIGTQEQNQQFINALKQVYQGS